MPFLPLNVIETMKPFPEPWFPLRSIISVGPNWGSILTQTKLTSNPLANCYNSFHFIAFCFLWLRIGCASSLEHLTSSTQRFLYRHLRRGRLAPARGLSHVEQPTRSKCDVLLPGYARGHARADGAVSPDWRRINARTDRAGRFLVMPRRCKASTWEISSMASCQLKICRWGRLQP